MRVQIMGEDLVAFRDSNGRVGLIEPNCAHRGANLFFGRTPSRSPLPPEELGRHISAEIVKWREIITRGGITLDP